MKAKIIDVICFVGGGALFVGTLFSYKTREDDGIFFYPTQFILLSISVGLIILGFLIRSWRKQN